MIKKFILGIVVIAISSALIYGGIYRTNARTESGKGTFTFKGIKSSNQGKSSERNQGQLNNRSAGKKGQPGEKNEQEYNHALNGEENGDLISFTGEVTQVNEDQMTILSEKGIQIVIENRAWWFALEAGFNAEIGDSVLLNGFFETPSELEIFIP